MSHLALTKELLLLYLLPWCFLCSSSLPPLIFGGSLGQLIPSFISVMHPQNKKKLIGYIYPSSCVLTTCWTQIGPSVVTLALIPYVMYLNDPNAIMCKEGVKFFRFLLLIEGISHISVRFLHRIFIEHDWSALITSDVYAM